MYAELRAEDETVLVTLRGNPARGLIERDGVAHSVIVFMDNDREAGRGFVGDDRTIKRGLTAINLDDRRLLSGCRFDLRRSVAELLEMLELKRTRGVLKCDNGAEIPGTLVSGPPNRANFIFDAVPNWTQAEELLK